MSCRIPFDVLRSTTSSQPICGSAEESAGTLSDSSLRIYDISGVVWSAMTKSFYSGVSLATVQQVRVLPFFFFWALWSLIVAVAFGCRCGTTCRTLPHTACAFRLSSFGLWRFWCWVCRESPMDWDKELVKQGPFRVLKSSILLTRDFDLQELIDGRKGVLVQGEEGWNFLEQNDICS